MAAANFREHSSDPALQRRKLRIVQIVENLEVGGLERLAIDLAAAQKAAGHQPAIYCTLAAGALAPQAEATGIPVIAFENRGRLGLPGLIWRMARQLRRDAADVVHTHNSTANLYGACAARLAGVPAILNTRHGPANSYGLAYRERYFRISMAFTDAVVMVCEDSRRILIDRGVRGDKVAVILNGIPVVAFAAAPAAPGSARPRIRFGTVGRMVPVKGHAVLLRAFAVVARRLADAELRIVGGGPLHNSLAAQACELGIHDRVKLEPTSHDVSGVLKDLDVFVLSSTSEGLPVAILEAMAAGLPIVSTRVGGVPEVAPEGQVAWLCAPGNADELAEAMCAAAISPRLAEMGHNGRRIVQECYSVERMSREYEALYWKCLSRRGAA